VLPILHPGVATRQSLGYVMLQEDNRFTEDTILALLVMEVQVPATPVRSPCTRSYIWWLCAQGYWRFSPREGGCGGLWFKSPGWVRVYAPKRSSVGSPPCFTTTRCKDQVVVTQETFENRAGDERMENRWRLPMEEVDGGWRWRK